VSGDRATGVISSEGRDVGWEWEPGIHPTAIVNPKAELARDVSVGPGAIIEADAVIGRGTRIGSYAFVGQRTNVGTSVTICLGAVVGSPPQTLKYEGEPSRLSIGARTVVREYATLNRGSKEGGLETHVGEDCLLQAYSHVAHDCQVGNYVIIGNASALAGHVLVEDYAIISGLVPVHQFVRVGAHTIIGGGYRIPKDVPPYVRAGGEPLRPTGLNIIGLTRRGFSTETIAALKCAYRLFFRSGFNTTQALERAAEAPQDDPHVQHFLEFVRTSGRGIIK
jgi:UDP-N-acetylglucosamine acyltransferase